MLKQSSSLYPFPRIAVSFAQIAWRTRQNDQRNVIRGIFPIQGKCMITMEDIFPVLLLKLFAAIITMIMLLLEQFLNLLRCMSAGYVSFSGEASVCSGKFYCSSMLRSSICASSGLYQLFMCFIVPFSISLFMLPMEYAILSTIIFIMLRPSFSISLPCFSPSWPGSIIFACNIAAIFTNSIQPIFGSSIVAIKIKRSREHSLAWTLTPFSFRLRAYFFRTISMEVFSVIFTAINALIAQAIFGFIRGNSVEKLSHSRFYLLTCSATFISNWWRWQFRRSLSQSICFGFVISTLLADRMKSIFIFLVRTKKTFASWFRLFALGTLLLRGRIRYTIVHSKGHSLLSRSGLLAIAPGQNILPPQYTTNPLHKQVYTHFLAQVEVV